MHKKLLVGLITVLALYMGGCQGEESEPIGEVPEPTTEESPSDSQAAPKVAPFADPDVDAQPRLPAASGLIETMPPQEQVKKVEKGRSDPFATLTLQPEVTVSPNPQAQGRSRPVPVVPQVPSPPQTRRGTNGNGSPGGGNQTRGTGTGTNGSNVIPEPPTPPGRARANGDGGATANGDNGGQPGSATASGSPIPQPPPLVPELPKLPDPTLARQVEVEGVVQVGNVPRAIVKVPNQPSRYVQEGQRISNGQVLVKRIELNRGPTPVVVLEQYGQEVARQVGEEPAGTPAQAESSTALPPPPA
ncbi:MAG: hypothetical protein RIE73_36270 [Coleofasciculus sp. C1-SOL-03]|uniref:hypothetical protein n=1 Tax=Coleofasciculus sp. C1-SOL-03 TaxID=3069522 RepID=UPI0033040943